MRIYRATWNEYDRKVVIIEAEGEQTKTMLHVVPDVIGQPDRHRIFDFRTRIRLEDCADMCVAKTREAALDLLHVKLRAKALRLANELSETRSAADAVQRFMLEGAPNDADVPPAPAEYRCCHGTPDPAVPNKGHKLSCHVGGAQQVRLTATAIRTEAPND